MAKKLALLIGVSNYGDGLLPLPMAENDVKALQRVLLNPQMGGFDLVEPLINPDLVTMQRAIRKLFADGKSDDLLLLFFSGHGVKDRHGNFYLTTNITGKDDFNATAVPATFVQNNMRDSAAKKKVIILDCCYGGALANNWNPKQFHEWALLASSTAARIAFEEEESGIYTRYLIEGIETGAADLDGNGIICVNELHKYAKAKVQEAKPQMKVDIQAKGEGFEIALAKASTKVEYDRTWQCVHTLTDHSQKVNCIAISPDDRTFVSASADKTIKIWKFWTGELIETLSGHTGAVNSIAISPDGKTIVSGSDDKTIKLWNWNDPQKNRTLSGSLFNKIWNWSSRQLIRTLGDNLFYEDSDVINSVAITPDGKTLLAGGINHKVKQWNLENGKELNNLSEHSLGVYSIAVTPDGKKFASDSQDGTIKLFNLETKELLQTFSGHSGWIWSIAISPNGKMLAGGSGDKTINLWDLETGKLLYTFNGHSESVRSVNFSFDSQTVISGSYDRTIKLWDIKTGNLIRTLTDEHLSCVNYVTFSRDGRSIVSGSDDGTIKIWK